MATYCRPTWPVCATGAKMRVPKLLALACLVASCASVSIPPKLESLAVGTDLRSVFDVWRARFGRVYSEGQELEHRFAIFADNWAFVQQYNAEHASHQLSINTFADQTAQEFAAHRLGTKPDLALRAARATPFRYESVQAPASVDWRLLGGVTAVKDQKQCGSCWAFSTTGSLEGANFVTNQQLVALSEQELLDCDRAGNDRGCNGGLMDYAYDWIIKNGGLDTEADYPYSAADGTCDAAKKKLDAVVVKAFEDVPPNNEQALKKAVANQPVAIAVAAGGLAFQMYHSGVFDAPCGTALDHGMLIVGYGSDEESGKDYWIVKNSWGEVWGEEGFMRMAMNVSEAGQCGLAMLPSYPIVGPTPPQPTPGPPGPGPDPAPAVVCDPRTTCPAGSTCCCSLKVWNVCLKIGCCPYAGATCCADGGSCCPATHPVCDLDANACTGGDKGASVALGKKFAATSAALPFSRAMRGDESGEQAGSAVAR